MSTQKYRDAFMTDRKRSFVSSVFSPFFRSILNKYFVPRFFLSKKKKKTRNDVFLLSNFSGKTFCYTDSPNKNIYDVGFTRIFSIDLFVKYYHFPNDQLGKAL